MLDIARPDEPVGRGCWTVYNKKSEALCFAFLLEYHPVDIIKEFFVS